MKIAMTTVGSIGPEDETHNENRVRAGSQALEIAKSKCADIVVLPTGFFFYSNPELRRDLADAILERARQPNLAVIFGFDVQDGDKVQAYGYAWSPAEDITYCWRQRSLNRRDQWDCPQRECDEVRLLKLDSGVVGVLLCGELFNERIRNALINKKPTIIVDLIHISSGFRSKRAMEKICHAGMASSCSAHVKKHNAMKRCYIPGEGNVSTRGSDSVIEGPPRIELKLFEIT